VSVSRDLYSWFSCSLATEPQTINCQVTVTLDYLQNTLYIDFQNKLLIIKLKKKLVDRIFK